MENIWTCDPIPYILNNMLRLLKHILEEKVLFYGVIVRTYWMTLVLLLNTIIEIHWAFLKIYQNQLR